MGNRGVRQGDERGGGGKEDVWTKRGDQSFRHRIGGRIGGGEMRIEMRGW